MLYFKCFLKLDEKVSILNRYIVCCPHVKNRNNIMDLTFNQKKYPNYKFF